MTQKDDMIGKVFKSRYEISERVGRGGFGSVFKIIDRNDNIQPM